MSNDATVNRAYSAWMAAKTDLDVRQRALATAIQLYVDGQGPVPDDLVTEVQGYRTRCNALFSEMLEAIKARADSRFTGLGDD